MKACAFLLGTALCAASPLRVAAVLRTGLPPYDGAAKVYRLEGPDCAALKVGESLVLKRAGERRSLGRLEVVSVRADHADTRLAEPGELFPLKGDLAWRLEEILALPATPVSVPGSPLPKAAALQPATVARPVPAAAERRPAHREPVFFLKGDASLSPGAHAKLRAWVEAWGAGARWTLESPAGADPALTDARTAALRAELNQLGVPSLEVKQGPAEAPGRYDPVYVLSEP
jgi:hypothetical protein